MLRLVVSACCLSGALRRKSLLDFLQPHPSLQKHGNSTQLGPRGERGTMSNARLISEPTACQRQRNRWGRGRGRRVLPRGCCKGKGIPTLAREGCRRRIRDAFVGEAEMGWRTWFSLGAWWPWGLGQDKPVDAKIHTWIITIS